MGNSSEQEAKAHAACLHAICALSERAPALGISLLEDYSRHAKDRKSISPAFQELIRLLVEALSHPHPLDYDSRVALVRAYATLSLSPDGYTPWVLWRTLCKPLLRHWMVAARDTPWPHELFLQALQTLSLSKTGRAKWLLQSAIRHQPDLLLDQLAHLPTPQGHER